MTHAEWEESLSSTYRLEAAFLMPKLFADWTEERSHQHAEICKLKNDEGSWIEREALVCPEGVSFETVIKQLQADVERLQKALDIT